MLVWTVIQQLAAFGGVMILARSLGPAGFGSMAAALSMHAYLLAVSSVGARSIFVQELAAKPAESRRLARALLVLCGSGGLVVVAVTAVTIFLSPRVLENERGLFAFIAVGSGIAAMAPTPLFEARHRQLVPAAIVAIAELGMFVVLIVFRDRLSLTTVGAIFATKWVLSSLCQWLMWIQSEGWGQYSDLAREVSRLARRSIPVLGALLMGLVPQHAGALVVRFVEGPESAASLGIAQFAGQAFIAVALLGVSIAQPHIASQPADDRSFRRKLCILGAIFLVALAVVVAVVTVAVISRVLPGDFEGAVIPALLQILAGLILIVASIAAFYTIRLNVERLSLFASTVALCAWVFCGMLLVPFYGAAGAATAAVAFAVVRAGFLFVGLRSRVSGR